jgi:hypothetical protein
MSKKILMFGALFLTALLINIVSAVDVCWVEASSADCTNNNGYEVMGVSGSTNAHGELAGQSGFAPVLCCNFGEGDTTCGADNKVLGLYSPTNSHAEAPDIPPNYNNDVCYDSLKDCSSVDVGFSCAIGEIEVVYISDLTNAHIEDADLGASQNYDTKICCIVELPMQCDLTSAGWEYGEVMEGADVEAIVNGTGCSGFGLSFEVFRKKAGTDESCDDITGCVNPANVVFGAGSNSVSGIWNAGPYHDNKYYFVVEVVANPSESEPSSEPDLLVIFECPYDPEPVICSGYTNESHCNSNVCDIDVQNSVPGIDCDDPSITCECVWEDNECKGSWSGGDGGYCGDGTIDSGEQCDGSSNWGDITNCSNFDVFTGGTLSCNAAGTSNECQFNTSLCTGGVDGGYCGDDVINPGETCDGSSAWGPITGCEDFDAFTGSGTLSCDNCQFDTSQCVGPGGAGAEIGTCIYTQFTDDTCDDDGFLTFTWNTEWVWDAGCDAICQNQAENLALKTKCDNDDGLTDSLECPAQIPLPFFNIYSFVAALIIIALIYTAIILSKKKKIRFV